MEPNTVPFYRNERAIEICEEAIEIICQIDREFENIERRYNKLIEQKTIFASRAAARIRYILQEGSQEEDQTVALINLLNRGDSRQNVLEELTAHMRTTAQFRVITEQSFYSRREGGSQPFTPVAVEEQGVGPQEGMESFVLKPLYTKQQIREFMQDNMTDGVFRATADSVQSVEDLEKLFLVWQDMTEHAGEVTDVRLGEEIETGDGLRFSSLQIKENAK